MNTKGMATPLTIGIVAVIVVLGGIAYYNTRPEGEIMMEEGESMMEEGEKMMEEGEDIMNEGEQMMQEGEQMMGTVTFGGTLLAGTRDGAPLLVFNEADYQKAIASDKLVALYFYANWCPVCREEFPRMEAAFDGLDTDNVVGFRVNFNDNETSDAEVALAREFGVAYQHTKVFLKDGERVLKSPESWSQARYSQEINAYAN